MKKRILAVDDELEILNLIKRYLVSMDYEIDTAMNGEAALDMLGKKKYDIVITDVRFPGKYTGMDILRAAKKKSRNIEVIMMTAYASVQNAVEAMKLGAYHYLVKPFDLFELKTMLSRIFETSEIEKSLENSHEAVVAMGDSAEKSIAKLESMIEGFSDKLCKARDLAYAALKQLPPKSKSHKYIKDIIRLAGGK